mgnify:CR=1 FL=1
MLINYISFAPLNGGLIRTGLALLFVVLLVVRPSSLQAEIKFEWDGFGSFGIGVLDDNSINESNSFPHNSFDEDLKARIDTRLGIQGNVTFENDISLTLQVVTYGHEDMDTDMEWAYLAYDLNQNIKLRIGRLRRPLYASSDFLPVGYVYVWARPPLEVYPNDLAVFDSLDAIDLLFRNTLGMWDLTTEVYYGGSSDRVVLALGEEGDFRTRRDIGVILEMQKDWLKMRLGYHHSAEMDVDTSSALAQLYASLESAGFGNLVNEMETQDMYGDFYNLATTIDYDNWLLSMELVRINTGGGLTSDEESGYVMGGRRIGPWTLHFTYAERQRKIDRNFAQPVFDLAAIVGPPANAGLLALANGVVVAEKSNILEFHSYTLGLRYDFAQPISIKTEYQHIIDKKNDLTNNLVSVVVDFLF